MPDASDQALEKGALGSFGIGGGIHNGNAATLTIDPELGAKKKSAQSKATDSITGNGAFATTGGNPGSGGGATAGQGASPDAAITWLESPEAATDRGKVLIESLAAAVAHSVMTAESPSRAAVIRCRSCRCWHPICRFADRTCAPCSARGSRSACVPAPPSRT